MDNQTSAREERLFELLASCIDAGEPEREDMQAQAIAQHPEFAEELREYFTMRRQLGGITEPLKNLRTPLHDTPSVETSETLSQPPILPSLANYECVQRIDQGGMGVVYKARDRRLERFVALKMIRHAGTAGDEDVRRFHNEARRAAQLVHPQIVPIYEVVEENGKHFFTMQLMEGGSLVDRMKSGRLSPKAAVGLLSQVARGLHFAHQHGILHRDVKPGNILFDGNGQAMIADFGLAKQIEPTSSPPAPSSHAIAGTPMYMAPEQVQSGGNLTTAADIYGLGAVMYELLAGRPPFQAATAYQMLIEVVRGEPKRLRSNHAAVDRDLETICLKCLDKDPKRRYGSAEALADDLDRWLRNEPILARASSVWYSATKWIKRSPTTAVLSAFAATAVIVCIVSLLVNNRAIQREQKLTQKALFDRTQALKQLKRTRSREQRMAYLQAIALADRELMVGDADRAEAVLRSIANQRRGWEWRYLLRQCHGALAWAAVPFEPTCLAIHPTSGAVSIGGGTFGAAGQIATFDASLTSPTMRSPHKDSITAAAFDRNGKWFASADRLGTIHLYDGLPRPSDGRNVHSATALEGHRTLKSRQPIWSLAFSPDGKRLAWAGASGDVHLRDERGSVVVLHGHQGDVWDVSFSSGGQHLATAGSDGTIRIWSLPAGECVRTIKGHSKMVRRVAFSKDGRQLVSASHDHTARIWNLQDGVELRRLPHASYVTEALFADAFQVVTASVDGGIRVWDIDSGRLTATLRGHSGPVWDIAFAPDGQELVSLGEDGTVRRWQWALTRRLSGLDHRRWLTAIQLSRQGKVIAGITNDESIVVWRNESGPARSFETTLSDGKRLCLSGDGELLVVGGYDPLSVWKTNSGVKSFQVHDKVDYSIRCVTTNHNGRYIAVADNDNMITVWNRATKEKVRQWKSPKSIDSLWLSPSGAMLFTVTQPSPKDEDDHERANEPPSVVAWRTQSGEQYGEFRAGGGKLTFSLDGQMFCSFGDSTTVEVREATMFRTRLTIKSDSASISAIAFTGDASRVFAGHQDGRVALWDVSTGRRILTLGELDGAAEALAVRDDGTVLAASSNGTVTRWDAGLPGDRRGRH